MTLGFSETTETLDPKDWDEVRDLAYRMIDQSILHLSGIRDRPVWQAPSDAARAAFAAPPPMGPTALTQIYDELTSHLLPHSMGNLHPRFWMWYMGAGSFTGALADFLAAIDGSNLGAGNSSAALVGQLVTDWIRQMMGFSETASGTLVSGGSMANLIGLMAARNHMAGADLRLHGMTALPQDLRLYASDQVHACHLKSMNVLGLGHDSLSRIRSDANYRLDIGALRLEIQQDRAMGRRPACIIATAGTTNTGAIDGLSQLADLSAAEGLWLHIDGCIGALVAIAPENRNLVAGLERADSLALDLHKSLHAPFDVGCALLRDRRHYRQTFAEGADYLKTSSRGIEAAEMLSDYNLETSRSFRALKIYMTLREHGVEKFGRLIDQNIAQARYLDALFAVEPMIERMTPVVLDIVCFRYNPGGYDETLLRDLNREILVQLQESGVAAISDTVLQGRYCLRAAICNHRTRRADLDLLKDEILRLGRLT